LGSVQVEQLRAGRERLLDAYLVVRRTLDDVTDELQRADAEARAAADAVGRQNATERPDEAVDLRHDDAWDALGAFGETRSPSATKPPAGALPGPGEAVPAAPKAASTSGPGPDQQGKAPAEAPRLPSTNGGPARAIVAPEDAIESVRILRHEAEPSVPVERAEEAPEALVSSGGAGPVRQDVPGSPAGPETAGAETAGAETAGPETAGAHDVQGLFARIRASRAEATTTARQTLDQQDGFATSSSRSTTDMSGGGTGETMSAAPDEAPTGARTEDVPAVEAESSSGGPRPEEMGTDQEFFRRRDLITSRLESSLARKLKRALQDEQNSLLDRLRNLKVPATPASILPNIEEHPDRFVEAGRPLLEEAARAGADLAAALWGGAAPPDLALEGLDDLAEELGRAIAEPLRQRLELAFQSMDEDNGELADALGAAYREWKTQRIEAAAHDEVAAAFSRGSYLAFADGTPLRWVADASDAPCPDCEDNALAGEQVKAEPWPTGQLYPPAHPGCRCALAPDGASSGGRVRLAAGSARPGPSPAATG
ncbi:MAG: hypothetical protein ACLQVK_03715, partial [Acidimicrobiales bacterium]